MDLITPISVSISVSPIELAALKKLSLVGHMLAQKVDGYRAKEEQKTLVGVLDEVIRRIEISAATRSTAT